MFEYLVKQKSSVCFNIQSALTNLSHFIRDNWQTCETSRIIQDFTKTFFRRSKNLTDIFVRVHVSPNKKALQLLVGASHVVAYEV